MTAHATEIEERLQEISTLRNLAADSQDHVTKLEDRVAELLREVADKQTALDAAIEESITSREEATSELPALRTELDAAVTQRDELKTELENARNEVGRLEKELGQSTQRALALEESDKASQETVARLEKKIDEKEKALQESSEGQMDHASKLNDELEVLRSRIKVMSEYNETLENRLNEAFAIVQECEGEPGIALEPEPDKELDEELSVEDPDGLPASDVALQQPEIAAIAAEPDPGSDRLKDELKALSNNVQLCLIELEQGGRMLQTGQAQLGETRDKFKTMMEACNRLNQKLQELPPHILKEAHFRYIHSTLEELLQPMRATKAAFESTQKVSQEQSDLIDKLYRTLTSGTSGESG